MPDPREIQMPPEQLTDPPRPNPVKCASCVYFRAFSAAELKDSLGIVKGDGWCYALPPQLVLRASRADPKTGIVEPMHPPTFAGDLCRHWRGEFAGDATIAGAEALENMADDLAALVRFVREAVNVGRKGS